MSYNSNLITINNFKLLITNHTGNRRRLFNRKSYMNLKLVSSLADTLYGSKIKSHERKNKKIKRTQLKSNQ